MDGLGEKIKEFCNVYFEEYSIQAKTDPISFNDDHSAFSFFLLDKLVESFSAVGELLVTSEKSNMKYLRNPTYVLMRSCLTDVIVLNWLFTKEEITLSVDDSVKLKVDQLRKDHLKFYVSFLGKMQSLGLLVEDDKARELKVINSRFAHLLNEIVTGDFDSSKIGKGVPITKMLNSANSFNSLLVNAYRCYSIFSKVEHPGEFTRMIIEKTYSATNPMDEFMKSSIEVTESTIIVLASIFFNRPELQEKLEQHRAIREDVVHK